MMETDEHYLKILIMSISQVIGEEIDRLSRKRNSNGKNR